MSVKIIKVIIGAFVLSCTAFGVSFADKEGDEHYPIAGQENVTDEELTDHHDNVLHSMYDEYNRKLEASNKFYNGELIRREKLQEGRMERREISAELRRERAIQRADAHEEYLRQKAEMSKHEFEKKNYYVEVMNEKRANEQKQQATENHMPWHDYSADEPYGSKEHNEMHMQQ